jgi:hypothetical protein
VLICVNLRPIPERRLSLWPKRRPTPCLGRVQLIAIMNVTFHQGILL